MKKLVIFIFAFLMLFGNGYCLAEQTGEEEYEEGLFIYTPAQGKLLPWVETENGNEYQIIGLAPPDKTVRLTLRSESDQVWESELIAEGNGYFHAEIPADQMNAEHQYTLNAVSAAYEANVDFAVYSGTLSDFARDPLHLEVLSDLTEEEKAEYKRDMEDVEQIDASSGDSDENGEGFSQATVQIGPNEFRTKDYTYLVKEDGTATLVFYYGHEKNLVLPEIVDGYVIRSIDFSTLNSWNGVATITIPSGITDLGNGFGRNAGLNGGHINAFYVPKDHPSFVSVNGILYSKDLRELLIAPPDHPDKDMVIPNGTIQVTGYAFFGSTLRHVEFPESLKRIGNSSFGYTCRLRSVDISDGVRVLEKGAFRGSGIRRISIPSRAAVMGSICSECRNLEDVVVMPGNETVKSVDGVLFSADGETLMTYPARKEGKTYNVPMGTTTVAEYAFANSQYLKDVTLSDAVKMLENNAFFWSSIQSIVLPDSLLNIGNGVFQGCRNLDHFVVSRNHPTLDAVQGKYLYSKDHKIFYCYPSGLHETTFALEDGTEEIAPTAFSDALLSEIYLPEGLKRIGYGAFISSALKSIYIPGTVEYIGTQILAYCGQLETVAIEKGMETIGSYSFQRNSALKGVSVPETVRNIEELAFLQTGNVRIFTVENSFAHQYALQNQIQYDVTPGNYELFTQSVKDDTDPMRATGYAPQYEVEIAKGSTANIREKPSMDSRRVGRGEPGDRFVWLDTVESNGVTWYKIELEDGTTGYVHSKMAQLVE